MYSCTPLSAEPDLCEVVALARPAEKPTRFVLHVVLKSITVTDDSDDGVLTSDTWEEGTAGVPLAPRSPCYAVTMLLCQLTRQAALLRCPLTIIRKPFLSEGFNVSLTCCRMWSGPWPWRRLYVQFLPGDKQEDRHDWLMVLLLSHPVLLHSASEARPGPASKKGAVAPQPGLWIVIIIISYGNSINWRIEFNTITNSEENQMDPSLTNGESRSIVSVPDGAGQTDGSVHTEVHLLLQLQQGDVVQVVGLVSFFT